MDLSLRVLASILACLVLVAAKSVKKSGGHEGEEILEIRMPGAKPEEEDTYLCTSIPVPSEEYIVKFEAKGNASTAHHMLVFGCDQPSVKQDKWECGGVCEGEEKIMFAWARNAPPTQLPDDVGFHVGGNSGIDHIVLQIHYLRSFEESEPGDHSGIRMTVTKQKQKYLAGIYLLIAWNFQIPGNTENVHGDISCKYEGPAPIYPFAFRTHAHDLGKVISGYQYNDSWHILGRGNPQWPQAFYPMKEKFRIKPGDYVVGRCTYSSLNRKRVTMIGSTHHDEMCNFYMMYYTDSEKGSVSGYCSGNHFKELFRKLPPGSDNALPANPNFGKTEDQGHGQVEAGLTVVPNWPHILPEDKLKLGQVAGVAVDSKGNVYIFHRGSRSWKGTSFDAKDVFREKEPIQENTLVKFDKDSGKIIKQWGANMFYLPHGLHIDNEDNIWLTDVAMHQVFKFDAGVYDKPSITLGTLLTPGSDGTHFCKPADVAVLSTGEFFVADGYCNSRIIKFSADGTKILKTWGTYSHTDPPGPSEFAIPHSLALVENYDKLCVADRENGRIQCFDVEGNYQSQIALKQFNGRVFAVTYDHNAEVLYAVNGPSLYDNKAEVLGFTIDLKGNLLNTWNTNDKGLRMPHDVAVSRDGTMVFVGEIDPNKLWKFNVSLPNKGVHQAQKKYHHPASSDEEDEEDAERRLSADEGEGDFGASLIIGLLLVVPVIVVIIITIVLRLRAKGAMTKKGHKYTKLMAEDKAMLLGN